MKKETGRILLSEGLDRLTYCYYKRLKRLCDDVQDRTNMTLYVGIMNFMRAF